MKYCCEGMLCSPVVVGVKFLRSEALRMALKRKLEFDVSETEECDSAVVHC